MTCQYFIQYTQADHSTGLYCDNGEAVTTNFVDMALDYAKALATKFRGTRYTVLRYRDGLPAGEVRTYEVHREARGWVPRDLSQYQQIKKGQPMRTCDECGREFDLFDETDAAEWYYGHDCEVES